MFSVKCLTKRRREFILETHLDFLEYVKDFDKLFEVLQSKNIPNLLLKIIIRHIRAS
jgi:hypothetical protein